MSITRFSQNLPSNFDNFKPNFCLGNSNSQTCIETGTKPTQKTIPPNPMFVHPKTLLQSLRPFSTIPFFCFLVQEALDHLGHRVGQEKCSKTYWFTMHIHLRKEEYFTVLQTQEGTLAFKEQKAHILTVHTHTEEDKRDPERQDSTKQ